MSSLINRDDEALVKNEFIITLGQLPEYSLMRRLTIQEQRKIKSFAVFKRPNNFLSAMVITYDDQVYGIGENGYNANILAMGGRYYRCDKVDRPVKVEGLSGKQIQTISLGVMVGAALDDVGHLYWWGLDVEYNDGIKMPELAIHNENYRFSSVSCGHSMIAAILTDSTVHVWGCISKKSYYTWDQKKVTCPENQSVVRIINVSCGYSHIAVVTEQGEVHTWGRGDYGQLGYTNYVAVHNRPQNKKITLGSSCSLVVCGKFSTFCLTTAGELWACGANSSTFGYLGVESKVYCVMRPEKVVLSSKVTNVFAFWGISNQSIYAAQTTDGLYTWSREGIPVKMATTVAGISKDLSCPQAAMILVRDTSSEEKTSSKENTSSQFSSHLEEKLQIIKDLIEDINQDIKNLDGR